jgi:mono/diheme cytochrome c family protein
MRNACFSGLLAVGATISVSSLGQCQDGGQGKYWYVSYCASCHGTSGKGDGSVAKVLTQKPADLTALAAANGGEFPTARVMVTIDGRREDAAHGPETCQYGEGRCGLRR